MIPLLLLTAEMASCGDVNDRHHKSSDGKTEVVYTFDDEAIFRHRFQAGDGSVTLRYDVARAMPGEEPDDPSVTRDKIQSVLVRDLAKGCFISTKTGLRMVVVGYEPVDEQGLSFDELVKSETERTRLFWLIDAQTVIKAKSLDELGRLAPDIKTELDEHKLKDAPEFFAAAAALAAKK